MTRPDPLVRCPGCRGQNVYGDYLRLDDGSVQPGCTDCELTLPVDEWAARVLAVRPTST